MKLRISLLTFLLLCANAALGVEHTKDSLDKVQENLSEKKAVIVDVREQGEWNRGHLADAQLLPLSELRKAKKDPAVRQKVEQELPKNRIIYCHCASGVRVLSAADILGKMGYDVRPLASGFDDLREAGFPVAEKP